MTMWPSLCCSPRGRLPFVVVAGGAPSPQPDSRRAGWTCFANCGIVRRCRAIPVPEFLTGHSVGHRASMSVRVVGSLGPS